MRLNIQIERIGGQYVDQAVEINGCMRYWRFKDDYLRYGAGMNTDANWSMLRKLRQPMIRNF